MNSTTTKTPGYNCRIVIKFTSDKNGNERALYRRSNAAFDARWLPIKREDAHMFLAQEQADDWSKS